MPWISESIDASLAAIAAALGTIAAGFLVVRRRLSSDATAIAREQGERTWVHQLLEEGRPEDARNIGRLEATAQAYKDRLDEVQADRDRKFGACEERVRSLSEQVLDLKLANGRLYQALAIHDREEADRLLVLQLRPAPPGPGDEPP
jgi:uncharacterized protein HemX